ncbi:hypothetical protein ACEPAF_9069 [Sanghuangporus sanghuang]
MMPNGDQGKLASWGPNLSDWLILICIDYALYLRIRALYSLEPKGKRMARYIFVLFLIEASVALGILIHEVTTHTVTAMELLGFSYCDVAQAPDAAESSLMWIVVLLYQIIAATLSVLKAVRLHRTLGLRGARLVRVITVLIDERFPSILICGIFNLIGALDLSLPAPVQVLYCTIGNTSVLSLVGSRMLINLKQAAEETPGEGGSLRLPTHPSTDVFRTISTRRESVLGQSHILFALFIAPMYTLLLAERQFLITPDVTSIFAECASLRASGSKDMESEQIRAVLIL